MAAGDQHGARAQVAPLGVEDDHVAVPGDALGGGVEVHRHVELLQRLLAQQLHQVLGQHPGMAGHVEDPLLRVQRGELAAQVGQRVDDPRAGLAHPRPEGGRQAHRPGADDRQVADLVEVPRQVGVLDRAHVSASAATGSPSSAPSARSTEHATQVKVGVSRSV